MLADEDGDERTVEVGNSCSCGISIKPEEMLMPFVIYNVTIASSLLFFTITLFPSLDRIQNKLWCKNSTTCPPHIHEISSS